MYILAMYMVAGTGGTDSGLLPLILVDFSADITSDAVTEILSSDRLSYVRPPNTLPSPQMMHGY